MFSRDQIENTRRPTIGIGVIVLRNGRVLLGKRKGAHGLGSWSFPGGHLEFNEALEDCAQREVREETGISIKKVRKGPFTNDIFVEEKRHYVTLYMIAEFDSGEVRVMEPDKCEGWRWFDWDALPDPLFLPIQNLRAEGYRLF